MSRERKENKKQQRRELIIFAAVLALVLVIMLVLVIADNQLTYELVGKEQVQLSYGESWSPEGVRVHIPDGPLHDFIASRVRVSVENNVDVTQPGTYKVVYLVKALLSGTKVEQMVTVSGDAAPVITLVGNASVSVPAGQSYQEEGFTATDDVDGDITDRVVRTETAGEITYSVTDSAGHTVEVKRTITYVDATAPMIQLLGEEEIILQVGQVFADPGFTATDDVDGDLSAAVTVEGTVDTETVGVYTLTYSVSDAAGNRAEMKRTVEVTAIPDPDKVIYLTFDDGPGPYTEELLGVLKKYNVKATFFVVNTGHLDLLPKIVEQGHTIAVHTLTHDYSKMYVSEEAYFNDLYAMQKIIKDKTGVTTTMLRFPGGSSNAGSKEYCKGIMTRLTKAVVEAGFQYYDWTVDSQDATNAKTSDEVYNNVIKGIGKKNKVIVLQHDIKHYSVQAVERIIQWGLENGYTFMPLTRNGYTVHHSTLNN